MTEKDTRIRNILLKILQEKGEFPREIIKSDLEDGGLYPESFYDEEFTQKLLKKTEFADTKSTFDPTKDQCESGVGEFEITPVQRFVANFMNPRTPYMSALLYHGVGVGKTCAAITTAEQYLDIFPRTKVIIVAPKNIQQGFYKTIFDINQVVFGKTPDEPNTATNQCTGDLYMRLTDTLYSRNKEEIERKVKRAIDSRYEISGYVAFSNRIKSVLKRIIQTDDLKTKRQREAEAIRNEFSYRLVIIDEAHNLRDISGVSEDEDIDSTKDEEGAEGKILTPQLNALINLSEGIKLLLMTATPMFNSVREIIPLLNLLLRNDKKIPIDESKLLTTKGLVDTTGQLVSVSKVLTDEDELAEGAEDILRPIASSYISYMRGENPNSFPVRLEYNGGKRFKKSLAPRISLERSLSLPIPEEQKSSLEKIPIVLSQSGNQKINMFLEELHRNSIEASGSGYTTIDFLIQASNCVFPNEDEDEENSEELNVSSPQDYVGASGFDKCFRREGGGGGMRLRTDNAKWLEKDRIGNYSPKIAAIVKSIMNAEGVCFMYSRFVKVGALLCALALEANGFTRWKGRALLANGNQSEDGRQCALCSTKEKNHGAVTEHEFTPAYYVLLTGNKLLSPNNAEAISSATIPENKDGKIIKVVLGSQIAGEGLNLKFIREIHILDAWFHLNKTEQIIGRGQRFLSHCLLPPEKRNVTVFLHTLYLGKPIESADMYAYRLAIEKAKKVGMVSRLLKVYAMDCHLRKGATVLTNLPPRRVVDSQGRVYEDYDVNDKNYTALCDWQVCQYECLPALTEPIDMFTSDDSTYDTFSAQYRLTVLKKVIERLFARQSHYTREELETALQITKAPPLAIEMFLRSILDNPEYKFTFKGREGYIIYKNQYYVFQPSVYKRLDIPLAVRSASLPVKRDVYSPAFYEATKPVITTISTINEVPEDERINFWEALKDWTNELASGETRVASKDITTAIRQRTIDYPKLTEVFMDRLKMVIHMSKVADNREAFRKAVLTYFWDEWLTQKEQIESLKSYGSDDDMKIVGSESYQKSGSYEALRFVDANTNNLEYFCQGVKCPIAVAEGFRRMSAIEDPIKTRRATADKTGEVYGFMVPKRGELVFKTGVPHTSSGKPDRGKECAIVTAKTNPREKLLAIGSALEEAGEHNLNYDERHLSAPAEINNTTKACTLLDLGFRYLDYFDSNGLLGKRWFFRPVSAYLSGHRGILQKAVKVVGVGSE